MKKKTKKIEIRKRKSCINPNCQYTFSEILKTCPHCGAMKIEIDGGKA